MAAFAIDATIRVEPSRLRIVFRMIFLLRSPSSVVMHASASRDVEVTTDKPEGNGVK